MDTNTEQQKKELFTPGTWDVTRRNTLQYTISTDAEGYGGQKRISNEEDRANSFLIAEAKNMYEALKKQNEWAICLLHDIENEDKEGPYYEPQYIDRLKKDIETATEILKRVNE